MTRDAFSICWHTTPGKTFSVTQRIRVGNAKRSSQYGEHFSRDHTAQG